MESNFVTPPRTVRSHAGLNPAAEAREREADSKRRVKMARECIGGKNSFSLDQASDEDFINFKAGLRSASAIDDITFEEFHEAVMDVIVATSSATQIVRRSVLTASDIDEMVDEISSLFDPNTEVARHQRFLSSRRERNMAVQQWRKTVEREGNRLGHPHLTQLHVFLSGLALPLASMPNVSNKIDVMRTTYVKRSLADAADKISSLVPDAKALYLELPGARLARSRAPAMAQALPQPPSPVSIVAPIYAEEDELDDDMVLAPVVQRSARPPSKWELIAPLDRRQICSYCGRPGHGVTKYNFLSMQN